MGETEALAQQMISDATAVIRANPFASTARVMCDPVPAGEPGNYTCTWVKDLDLLGLYIPREGQPCRFPLIVVPGEGRHDSLSYVVTPEGVISLVRFKGMDVELAPLRHAEAAALAELVRQAARPRWTDCPPFHRPMPGTASSPVPGSVLVRTDH